MTDDMIHFTGAPFSGTDAEGARIGGNGPDGTSEYEYPADGGHDYVLAKSAGAIKGRVRCSHCLQYEDQNPGTCPAYETEQDLIGQVQTLCLTMDDTLGVAISTLIDGYRGDIGEGVAFEAGREVSGRTAPPNGTVERLEFLSALEPLSIRGANGTYTVQQGRASVANSSLEVAIAGLHQSKRPSCTTCGSTDYKRCSGVFSPLFTPESCDQCP